MELSEMTSMKDIEDDATTIVDNYSEDDDEKVYFKPLKRCAGCALKLHVFFPGWASDCCSRLLVLVFWLTMIVTIPLYAVNLYFFAKWFIGFQECLAFTATWVHLIGLGFCSGWVPYAILLADWEKESKIYRTCSYSFYWIGFLVTLIAGPVSLWMISRYWNDAYLIYYEWGNSTQNAMKNGNFPRWLTDLGWPKPLEWMGMVDCCAWHGPLDLGITMNFSVLNGGNKMSMETMNKIADCYNDLFATNQKGLLLSFEMKTEMESLPPGCGPIIREDLRQLSFFIIISCIIQTVMALLLLLIYSCYPYCFAREMRQSNKDASLHRKRIRQLNKTYPIDMELERAEDANRPRMNSPASPNNNVSPKKKGSKYDIKTNKTDHLEQAKVTLSRVKSVKATKPAGSAALALSIYPSTPKKSILENASLFTLFRHEITKSSSSPSSSDSSDHADQDQDETEKSNAPVDLVSSHKVNSFEKLTDRKRKDHKKHTDLPKHVDPIDDDDEPIDPEEDPVVQQNRKKKHIKKQPIPQLPPQTCRKKTLVPDTPQSKQPPFHVDMKQSTHVPLHLTRKKVDLETSPSYPILRPKCSRGQYYRQQDFGYEDD